MSRLAIGMSSSGMGRIVVPLCLMALVVVLPSTVIGPWQTSQRARVELEAEFHALGAPSEARLHAYRVYPGNERTTITASYESTLSVEEIIA
jgi:hypothetical protein